MIKAVIFDLDGTLGDTLPLCVAAFKRSIEPLIDRKVSAAEIIATFGPSEEGTILTFVPNHYEKAVADYLINYEALHDMCPDAFEGILDLLVFLKSKSIRMAMVTGKGPGSTSISLKKFGLTEYFEIIETGKPSGPSKPEGIMNVIEKFAPIKKSEIIYVGDAPSDVLACQKVDIPIIVAAWADTAEIRKLNKLKPNKMFYTISDFKLWLKHILR